MAPVAQEPKLSKAALRQMVKTLLFKQTQNVKASLDSIRPNINRYEVRKNDYIEANFDEHLPEEATKLLDKLTEKLRKHIDIKGLALRLSGNVCLANHYENYKVVLTDAEKALCKKYVAEAKKGASDKWEVIDKLKNTLNKLNSLHVDTVIYEIEYATMMNGKASGTQELMKLVSQTIENLIK